MDLLGSILDSMEKPPTASNSKTGASKKERQDIQKKTEDDRKKKLDFRDKVELQIQEFVREPSRRVLKFGAMDKIWRSIIRDVSDVAGLAGYSFGEEGVDRHTVVFKTQPSEKELQALQNGEEYDPAQAQDSGEEKEADTGDKGEEQGGEGLEVKGRRSKEKFVPASVDYHAKYKHIIGTETGLEAARKAEPNQKFGMVPSERKRDVRSIEETMIALRAKKKKENEGRTSSLTDDGGPV